MTNFHPTKTKGDIGVMKAKLALLLLGYMVLQPETEHAPFDIVTYKDGKFLRIQVKYIDANDGHFRVRFMRRWCNSHGAKNYPIDKDAIDLYCVYCPGTDLCYYIDPKQFGASVKIRIEKGMNDDSRSHDASDFLSPGAIV